MTGVPFSFGPGNEVNVVRYPGSLYLVVFDNLRWISYGCRFYIDVKNVIATLAMCHDRLASSQAALFVGKILVCNSKWLPHFSCVDFQGGSLWFLEGKHRFSIP